ncbi:MAG: methyltransferase domain-containing protein [Bacteroidota bacterium]|nr:methyltransferase domain-containing protein [Bacteroidota bacterium]
MDDNNQTQQTYNALAQAYQQKFMHLDLYNDTYNTFIKLLPAPNATIFEIGCGPGNITKYLLTKRTDFKIHAIDFAPNMITLAKENNPTAEFSVMDCRDIDQLTAKSDGIMCGFCLPYLSKEGCAKLVKDCAALLNNGGIFYFSAIEGEYSKSQYETSSDGKHKTFVYYHEENYLQEMLKENGFEVVDLIRKEYPKAGEISTHIIFIAGKK